MQGESRAKKPAQIVQATAGGDERFEVDGKVPMIAAKLLGIDGRLAQQRNAPLDARWRLPRHTERTFRQTSEDAIPAPRCRFRCPEFASHTCSSPSQQFTRRHCPPLAPPGILERGHVPPYFEALISAPFYAIPPTQSTQSQQCGNFVSFRSSLLAVKDPIVSNEPQSKNRAAESHPPKGLMDPPILAADTTHPFQNSTGRHAGKHLSNEATRRVKRRLHRGN